MILNGMGDPINDAIARAAALAQKTSSGIRSAESGMSPIVKVGIGLALVGGAAFLFLKRKKKAA